MVFENSTKRPFVVILTINGKKYLFLQFASGPVEAWRMAVNYYEKTVGPVPAGTRAQVKHACQDLRCSCGGRTQTFEYIVGGKESSSRPN